MLAPPCTQTPCSDRLPYLPTQGNTGAKAAALYTVKLDENGGCLGYRVYQGAGGMMACCTIAERAGLPARPGQASQAAAASGGMRPARGGQTNSATLSCSLNMGPDSNNALLI